MGDLKNSFLQYPAGLYHREKILVQYLYVWQEQYKMIYWFVLILQK